VNRRSVLLCTDAKHYDDLMYVPLLFRATELARGKCEIATYKLAPVTLQVEPLHIEAYMPSSHRPFVMQEISMRPQYKRAIESEGKLGVLRCLDCRKIFWGSDFDKHYNDFHLRPSLQSPSESGDKPGILFSAQSAKQSSSRGKKNRAANKALSESSKYRPCPNCKTPKIRNDRYERHLRRCHVRLTTPAKNPAQPVIKAKKAMRTPNNLKRDIGHHLPATPIKRNRLFTLHKLIPTHLATPVDIVVEEPIGLQRIKKN
jgi:hypothetical protein